MVSLEVGTAIVHGVLLVVPPLQEQVCHPAGTAVGPLPVGKCDLVIHSAEVVEELLDHGGEACLVILTGMAGVPI